MGSGRPRASRPRGGRTAPLTGGAGRGPGAAEQTGEERGAGSDHDVLGRVERPPDLEGGELGRVPEHRHPIEVPPRVEQVGEHVGGEG
ncbi:MAG: hypothetical protein ACK559_17005, partial [bacterium]